MHVFLFVRVQGSCRSPRALGLVKCGLWVWFDVPFRVCWCVQTRVQCITFLAGIPAAIVMQRQMYKYRKSLPDIFKYLLPTSALYLLMLYRSSEQYLYRAPSFAQNSWSQMCSVSKYNCTGNDRLPVYGIFFVDVV